MLQPTSEKRGSGKEIVAGEVRIGQHKNQLQPSRKLMASWFLIGFLVRVALAVVITALMVVNFEAGMWYLADFPTIFCFNLIEMLSPRVAQLVAGKDPFYIPLNILGALIWGLLFMLAALAVSLIKSRETFWPIRAKSQEGAVQMRD